MKTNVNINDFMEAFKKMGRENNFSYEGLEALFNYLEDFENETGEEIELDVIALCCDFTEYENMDEFQNNYGSNYETIDDIEQRTVVIYVDDPNKVEAGSGRFIIQKLLI